MLKRRAGCLALLALTAAPARADNVLQERGQRFQGVWSAGGVVAAEERRAGAVGAAVLRQGGNAVDAAVATAFALAVTLPQAGNLGGGGFLVLWLPGASPAAGRGCLGPGPSPELTLAGGTAVAVNFRETAPLAAHANLFLGADGSVDRHRASRSLASTAVPGSVAGLLLAQRCYGRLPRAAVLAPAITLAAEGFVIDQPLADALAASTPLLAADSTSRGRFLVGGRAPAAGTLLRQPELATTLGRVAVAGEAGFYRGPVAGAVAALMQRRGGLITAADLAAYRAQLVAPLHGRFRGHAVVAMPPPGGGVSLLGLLALLEPFDLATMGANGAEALHLMAEAMNLVYRDRNALLGDPDQVALPLQQLLAPAYTSALRQRIDQRRHRPADRLGPPPLQEGENTTHLSVADQRGGLAALTTTLNFPFGNGVSVPGTGVLLNNEMDDFSAQPGQPNGFGLVQGKANAIAPGRRPLSSMVPVLVFRPDGRPWLATGSPGGSRIITTVLQVLLNRIIHGLNLATAVAAPRLHSQHLPDRLDLEEGFSPDSRRLLEARGHRLRRVPAMGAANSVELLPGGGSLGVVDPRRGNGPAVAEGP
ncbi:MAG: gamma-glutamyltransferase [Cyanobacteriota bacterium]|nr:gamma-glutamyltransferase [Cyanobacteriota bacterium]